jgi:hypothetical protein
MPYHIVRIAQLADRSNECHSVTRHHSSTLTDNTSWLKVDTLVYFLGFAHSVSMHEHYLQRVEYNKVNCPYLGALHWPIY